MNRHSHTDRSGIAALSILGGLLLILFVTRLTIGPAIVSWHGVAGGASQLLWEFRLPQAIAAAFTGASLAVCGLEMQTVLQNPLAGPWVLGLVSGAQLGVALLILSGAVFGISFSGVLSPVSLSGIIVAAVVGSLFALMGVLKLARYVSSATLLMCGLLASAIADGVRNFLLHLVSVKYEMLFLSWNQAGFGGVTWPQLSIFGAAMTAGAALAVAIAKDLNGLLLGNESARSLGIRLISTRRLSMLSAVLLSGSATAFCGAVLFIDLAVPHLCRGVFRTSDHRFLVPATALTGACLALAADSVAGLMPGDEVLPVNIITCLLGGPVVLWVLLRGDRSPARFRGDLGQNARGILASRWF